MLLPDEASDSPYTSFMFRFRGSVFQVPLENSENVLSVPPHSDAATARLPGLEPLAAGDCSFHSHIFCDVTLTPSQELSVHSLAVKEAYKFCI